MPEIEVTEDQRERLRGLQRRLEEEMPSPYAHVRPTDAVAYLLDQYADDPSDVDVAGAVDAAGDRGDDGTPEDGESAPTSGAESVSESTSEAANGDGADDGGSSDLPSGPMNLLADHADVWRESSGDARYEVDLPDGGTAEARTKGDVRALLFEHYR